MLKTPLLGLSVEDNLAPKLEWLQSLDLSGSVLGVLGYSVEDNMAPKLDWLQRRLDLDEVGAEATWF